MKKHMPYFIFFICLLISQPGSATEPEHSNIFQPGEVLTYSVHWNFIRLGSIVIQTYPDSSKRNPLHFTVSMRVRSNPDIPFIDIDELNRTLIHGTDITARCYRAVHRHGSDSRQLFAVYDETKGSAYYSAWNASRDAYENIRVIPDTPPYLDGPSLFFFTRHAIHSGKQISMPTMINGKIEITHFDFRFPREDIQSDLFPHGIHTKRYSGFADWEGGTSAGMSGEFSGWISDDTAAVVIRSEVKILLGSLVIELEKYERPGWIPPLVTVCEPLSRKGD